MPWATDEMPLEKRLCCRPQMRLTWQDFRQLGKFRIGQEWQGTGGKIALEHAVEVIAFKAEKPPLWK